MAIQGKNRPDIDAVYAQRKLTAIIVIAAPVIAPRTDCAAIKISALTAGRVS
jgi:hypothetical protein